jgi:hypothetical protein
MFKSKILVLYVMFTTMKQYSLQQNSIFLMGLALGFELIKVRSLTLVTILSFTPTKLMARVNLNGSAKKLWEIWQMMALLL